jgi:hypothetical protein
MDYPGRNPWAVLGVAEDASPAQIRHAFRQQVRRTHPDAGGRADRFIAVKAAYDALRRASASVEPADEITVDPPTPSVTPYDSWLRPMPRSRVWAEPRPSIPEIRGRVSFDALLKSEMAKAGVAA